MSKPVTRKMAVDCLLHCAEQAFQDHICCVICNEPVKAGQDIQFDHRHAIVFDGPHEYQNLRPVHAECHKRKTSRDIKDNAKIKRIRGETKTKPRKRIASKPFPKPPKGYSSWTRSTKP